MTKKRKVDVLVISDVHLGTYGCRAKELLNYLSTVEPKVLILNGDIIDIWQFSKRYFPQSHMKVIKKITGMLSRGTTVHYITGNHDEMLRKFKGFSLGNFHILNKLVLDVNGQKAWIFHGDVFDITMKHSKWLARLGGVGYDMLIIINTLVNGISERMGRGRISFSKKIKNSVKRAIKHISDFEETAAEIAMENEFDYVLCGHIHQPQMRTVEKEGRSVQYLNSGDWVENMTALEYHDGQWSLYSYMEDAVARSREKEASQDDDLQHVELRSKELFHHLIDELTNDPLNTLTT
ncbi:MAG: UDP-2,3-diacylglucosamine diphosphatase [Flavobacteriales bacterium]|nr:UDP-2,3-diacylglucosamine diphosphatase [Flavobacteriales bacterium]